MIEELDQALGSLKTLTGLSDRARQAAKTAQEKLDAADVQAKELAEAIQLCRLCAQDQVAVVPHLEALTTEALRVVKADDSYGFAYQPELDSDDNVVGLVPCLIEGEEVYPVSSTGGGALNIVSVLKRLLFTLLRPDLNPVILLDEPNANLDDESWPRWVAFMERLAEMGLQVVLVTHASTDFPTQWRIQRSGRISQARRLT